jgi:hydroxypyruvate reductase
MAASLMKPANLMTQSLRASPHGQRVARILAAALEAVDPARAVEKYLLRDSNQLIIGDQVYYLPDYDRIFLIGFGKASIPMGRAAVRILAEDLTQGILISKEIPSASGFRDQSPVSLLEGGHPVPDQRSIQSAQNITEIVSSTTKNDLLICLISGGGSALLTYPVPGLALDDIQHLTRALLSCGATINEINCLRKHLSQVKGGQLARLAAPAQVATLILSDVIGDPLDVIASGPFVPDPTTFSDALSILAKYQILEQVPNSIRTNLETGKVGRIPETPKPNDPIFSNVQNLIIGNNYQAAQAALEHATQENFKAKLLTTYLQGEAREVGRTLAAITKQAAVTGDPVSRPACLIAGGETTVTIQGAGLGGRNLELALGAVQELAGLQDVMLITLATDGDDGPTDAAGAVVTGESLLQATKLGLSPNQFLAENNSYHFFEPLGDLIQSGLTHTNVNDLVFLLTF